MKKANLSELKCGDTVMNSNKDILRFIGLMSNGRPIVEEDALGVYIERSDLYLPPVKRVMWANIYTGFDSEELADVYAVSCRLGGKAFRIEYEE